MPFYIDGKVPVDCTTLDASIEVITPVIRYSSAANPVTVHQPTNADTLVTLTDTQTLSSKTLLNPVITSAVLTQPTVTTALLSSPEINLTGGQLSGGIILNTVFYGGPAHVLTSASPKTMDLATANVFICQLTGSATLTVENAQDGRQYILIMEQNITDGHTDAALPSNFLNNLWASGPTQATGAKDIYYATYFSGASYVSIAKDVQ